MLDTPINPSSFPSLQDIQNTAALNSNPILRNLKITQGYSDLRRVARIRAVANALVDAFERNQQLLRYGKARKAQSPAEVRNSQRPLYTREGCRIGEIARALAGEAQRQSY
jgi:hypothetical protein